MKMSKQSLILKISKISKKKKKRNLPISGIVRISGITNSCRWSSSNTLTITGEAIPKSINGLQSDSS